MTHKIITTLITIQLVIITSCSTNNKHSKITNYEDYSTYLETDNSKLEKAQAEKKFWEDKLENTPSQYTYLQPIAVANEQLFDITGNIEYLKEAEASLIKANNRTNNDNASLLRALAKNYITQHRFKEALDVLKKAELNGENLKGTQKMLFDVYLELGNETIAEDYLNKITDMNDFDYLIRLSKWSDHKGNLEAAIKYMEKAKVKAEEANNKGLKLWSYSNLADYYGHAGRIEDSYNHYLKTLALDPNYNYALKGIAWITFSHEKDIENTNKILNAITQKYRTPDIFLLKAEVADYQSKPTIKEQHMKAYFDLLSSENYGVMYDKYNALIYAEQPNTKDKALELAMNEVINRPTAGSYDLLAWVYLENGNEKKALEIAEKYVVGKTYEPEVQYHIAKIYKANNMTTQVNKFKNELSESVFELGPNMEDKITSL